MVSATMQAIQKASAEIQGASSNLAQATNGVKDMMDEHSAHERYLCNYCLRAQVHH